MSLERDICHIINASHDDCWHTFDTLKAAPTAYGLKAAQVAGWKSPGEPAFVSKLLEYPFSSGEMSRLIHRHLQPLGLASGLPLASGVFIHQKPKVKFSRCHIELGDILLVRQHFQTGTRSGAQPDGRALLIQAKASKKPQTGPLSGKDAEQHSLYADWKTPFRFVNKDMGNPPDGSPNWNFGHSPMPSVKKSGCYGIVMSDRGQSLSAFPSNCTWAAGDAQPPAAGRPPNVDASHVSLAARLAGLLLGSEGRPWVQNAATSDHWSSFVQRMLDVALDWRYPNQRLGPTSQPRRRDALAYVNQFSGLEVQQLQQTVHFPTWPRSGYPWFDIYRHDMLDGIRHDWSEAFPDRGFGPDLPKGDSAAEFPPPTGGLSVAYIATFGDSPLGEQSGLTNRG